MKDSEIKITEFFNNDYVQYASYDNVRKIASYIDGLKLTARKVMYTMIEHNIVEPKKVSSLESRVQEFTEYLHGAGSIGGVIVNMAQEFAGANNVPLLKREGTFGTRLIPQAAATRYISTALEPYVKLIFNPDDNDVLIEQNFEGSKIEPRFYVPTIPLILVNGSSAISTGFAQNILPRNPLEVIEVIRCKLQEKKHNKKLLPWFRGFEGIVRHKEDNSYEICGKISRVNTTKLLIEEIPVKYDLQTYSAILNKLEDTKAITSYTDKSTDGKFLFEISVSRDFSRNKTDDQLMSFFKLIAGEGENLTCCDENYKMVQFKCVEDLLDAYIKVKLDYTEKRRLNNIQKIKNNLSIVLSKYFFINSIVSGKLKVMKRSEEDIIKDLEEIKNIIKVEGSYSYLLNMPVNSLTEEKMAKLKEQCVKMKEELDKLEKITAKDLWINELDNIEKILKKML